MRIAEIEALLSKLPDVSFDVVRRILDTQSLGTIVPGDRQTLINAYTSLTAPMASEVSTAQIVRRYRGRIENFFGRPPYEFMAQYVQKRLINTSALHTSYRELSREAVKGLYLLLLLQ